MQRFLSKGASQKKRFRGGTRVYLEHWHLKEKPFQNTPDPRFLYFSRHHEESLSKLLYTVREGLGAAMLTGAFGTGKTVLAQALFDKVGAEKYRIASITNPQMDYVGLLRSIVRHLDSAELPSRRSDYSADYFLERLEKTLLNNLQDGKATLVVVDEAHLIKDEAVLEGLRLLLNLQHRNSFLLTLLLLGQPELRMMILSNKQLDQP
jgi:general secretion pathway protein A